MIYTLHDLLNNSVEEFPDKVALIHENHSLTYKEIQEMCGYLQSVILSTNFLKGDRVGILMEKRFEEVVSIFAISMCGGICVPIRSIYSQKQILHIINDSGMKILITTYSYFKKLKSSLENIHCIKYLIILDTINDEFDNCKIEIRKWQPSDNQEKFNISFLDVNSRDIAAILYTSGSTGFPKGVVLNHHNIIAGTKIVSEYLDITNEEKILSILTFSFDYGLNQLTSAFYKGSQLVLLNYLFPKDVLNSIKKYEITGLAAVSTTWIQLLQVPWDNESCKTLRYITNSGGTLHTKFVTDMRERIPYAKIFLMYGLTEAFRSTYLEPELINQHPNSIGKAVEGEEIFVVDEENNLLEPGQIGELVHRGQLVAQGYWNNQEATRECFRPNPFQPKELTIPERVVYSGDYVRKDKDGFLYFIGRKDEMIKSAGNRISPEEVEEIIYSSGFVSAVIAFGFPDDLYGQSVFIIVSALNKKQLDLKELKRFCHKNMPSYMIPKFIEIWENLPKNSNGKIDRSRIKGEIFKKFHISKDEKPLTK